MPTYSTEIGLPPGLLSLEHKERAGDDEPTASYNLGERQSYLLNVLVFTYLWRPVDAVQETL